MSECLVTKLKSTVDNSDLKELGVMYCTRTPSTSGWIELYANNTNSVKVTILDDGITITSVDSDGTLVDSNTVMLPTSGGFTVSTTNSVNIKMENKYDLSYVNLANTDIVFDDLKYYNNIYNLYADEMTITGDISNIQKHTNLHWITFWKSQNITGDIYALRNMVDIRYLMLMDTNVYGDITNLSKLTVVGSTGSHMLHFRGTQITGKMTDLFDGLYANGKTSGYIHYIPNNLVENVGEKYLNDAYRVYFTESGWTPSSPATE